MLATQIKNQFANQSGLRRLCVTAALTTGLALSAAGHASSQESTVTYERGELSTLAGAKDVHTRILRAAKDHCPSYSKLRDLKFTQSCIAQVTEDLVSKVDNPRLTAIHNGEDISQSIAGR